MKPITLVVKPTADEEVKASCIRILQDALKLAESGEIDNVVVILGRVDGQWHNKVSETVKMSEAIGRIEIIQHEWIKQMLAEEK